MMIPQPPLFEPTPHERRRPGAQMKRITRRMRARLLRASPVLCDSASSLLYIEPFWLSARDRTGYGYGGVRPDPTERLFADMIHPTSYISDIIFAGRDEIIYSQTSHQTTPQSALARTLRTETKSEMEPEELTYRRQAQAPPPPEDQVAHISRFVSQHLCSDPLAVAAS
jgi:hypothetical protein